MKKLPIIVLLLITVFIACKKSDSSTTTLTGKWKSTASAIDIGDGKAEWKAIPSKEQSTLTLQENGDVLGDRTYASYSVKDSVTIVFKTADNKAYPNYYVLKNNELILNNLACIEGCSIKYVKVK